MLHEEEEGSQGAFRRVGVRRSALAFALVAYFAGADAEETMALQGGCDAGG